MSYMDRYLEPRKGYVENVLLGPPYLEKNSAIVDTLHNVRVLTSEVKDVLGNTYPVNTPFLIVGTGQHIQVAYMRRRKLTFPLHKIEIG